MFCNLDTNGRYSNMFLFISDLKNDVNRISVSNKGTKTVLTQFAIPISLKFWDRILTDNLDPDLEREKNRDGETLIVMYREARFRNRFIRSGELRSVANPHSVNVQPPSLDFSPGHIRCDGFMILTRGS